jgi:hypothetical protein
MASVLGVGAPATMGVNHRPVEQGWMPPLVGPHRRLGDASLYSSNCVGLLLIVTRTPAS